MGSLDRFCTSAFGQILCGLMRLGEEHLLCVISFIGNSFWVQIATLAGQTRGHSETLSFGAGSLRTFIQIVL